uniref:Uncharacterized protein n=1 Tax=Arundo donax TaxID=35708 RepID=A0A0A9E1M8_ARUDO
MMIRKKNIELTYGVFKALEQAKILVLHAQKHLSATISGKYSISNYRI